MGISELTTFLGWVSVINVGILLFSVLMIMALKGTVARLHAKMFALSEDEVLRAYFDYLGQFKILVIVFNLAPYIALKLMV
ncbi:MAG: hypothetical protein DHS20C02_16170 [Micavibrio sp.]|nr:MAG: hypothetical protein DHS20C02_16170 [Micavibrio sp.]